MQQWQQHLDKIPELLRSITQLRLEQLLEAINSVNDKIELNSWTDHNRDALLKALAGSEFIARSLIQAPELLNVDDVQQGYSTTIDNEQLVKQSLNNGLEGVDSESLKTEVLMKFLRVLRRREMLGIAWRDISGEASVEQTLYDLSHLADFCVQLALETLESLFHKRYGVPIHNEAGDKQNKFQSLIVIAMGKLGGRELNFSSDIDLIFAFPCAGNFPVSSRLKQSLSYAQYFERLGQQLIKVLNTMTADGFVFRVDMRLRPYGNSGPLVMNLDSMEEYYQNQGRNWERYALIKARIIAGEQEDGEEFIRLVCPFVYRRYLDYDAFDELREMKSMINTEVQRKGMENNLKLGAGGIREVEFIGQAFQLVRGGRECDLQSVSILDVLNKLAAASYIEPEAIHNLVQAYLFLRRSENLLQEYEDKQIHAIPETIEAWQRLAWLCGFEKMAHYKTELEKHREVVQDLFADVFSVDARNVESEQVENDSNIQSRFSMLWLMALETDNDNGNDTNTKNNQAIEILQQAGFCDTELLLNMLRGLRNGRVYHSVSQRGRERLDSLMPLVMSECLQLEDQLDRDITLVRVIRLLEAIAGRSAYLALLIENPGVRSQLVSLCAISPWIAKFLTHHPVLLDELIDIQRLYESLYEPLDQRVLADILSTRMAEVEPDDLEQQMEVLRHFKNSQVLKVAAADIANIIPLMEVSNHLTAISEVILKTVLDLAWVQLSEKYGAPLIETGSGKEAGMKVSGFAIVAYGKMGGIELGYGSDLDLVFLHDSKQLSKQTNGEKSVETGMFFARLAQRIVHILNTRTHSGMLYEVDIRLRPNGSSGLLVSDIGAFAEYQRSEAWTWEHQALVRARVVAGDIELEKQFLRIRSEILLRSREADKLRLEVLEMRERMRSELGSKDETMFHLKQGYGGIADIEFIVQYAVLRWGGQFPDLIEFTDNIRQIDAMYKNSLISEKEADLLRNAYRGYRSASHRLTLKEIEGMVPGTQFIVYRHGISHLWQKWIENGKLMQV